ncbi:hypothetical protein ACUNV4_18365 [Granulosicoccus sp. 3-233]
MRNSTIRRSSKVLVTLLIISQLTACPLIPPRAPGGPTPAGAHHPR